MILIVHLSIRGLFLKITIVSAIACFTLATKIIREPEGERWLIEGQSVNQTCVFDVPVFCAWHKNGMHIKIMNRYSYISSKQQGKTEDCSINIRPFSVEDKGWWSCCNMEDSNGIKVVHSNKTWLGVQEMKIEIQPRTYMRVNRGSNVTLDCKFNTKVKCSWKKNNNLIENESVKYKDPNPQDKEDCSIILINIKKAQAGKWECQNMVTDAINKTVRSLVAEITVENPVVVIHPQSQTYKELYKTVYLNCTLNMPVNCYWSFESNPINNNRIEYTNSNGLATKDCSITINNFDLSDIGSWKCADKLDKSIVSQTATLQLVKQPTSVTCHCSNNCTVPFNCKNEYGGRSRSASLLFEEIRCSSIEAYPPPNMYWQIDNTMAPYEQPSIILFNNISTKPMSNGFWTSTLPMSIETYNQLNTCFNNYSLTCVVVHTGYENEKKTLKVGNINQCHQAHTTVFDTTVVDTTVIDTAVVDTTCSSCAVWIALTVIFGLIIIIGLSLTAYFFKRIKRQSQTKGRHESIPLASDLQSTNQTSK